jgi:hypothetical protein
MKYYVPRSHEKSRGTGPEPMMPEIDELRVAYKKALDASLKSVFDSRLALELLSRSGAIQHAEAYSAAKQIEAQHHAEYLEGS